MTVYVTVRYCLSGCCYTPWLSVTIAESVVSQVDLLSALKGVPQTSTGGPLLDAL